MRSGLHALRLGIAAAVVLIASCSGSAESAVHHNFVLVGSTACDAAIRAAVGIPGDIKCDFIRWNLAIDPANANAFQLDLNYGEGQPNTLGFIGGGRKVSAGGKFGVYTLKIDDSLLKDRPQNARTPGKPEVEMYRIKSERPAIDIYLKKLNPNLFHLLMPDGSMMIGNGGWSYTLNREPALASAPMITSALAPASDSPTRVIFDGRTPCREISELIGVTPAAECFKVKWRLTLDRDPATLRPTTFAIYSTFSREESFTGKWTEARTGDTVIYRLSPDASMKPISLMLAGDGLLFFLDGDDRPLVGNKDFSYTLNRRQ